MPPKSTCDKTTNEEILKELKEINVKLSILTGKVVELHCLAKETNEEKERKIQSTEVSQDLDKLCKVLECALSQKQELNIETKPESNDGNSRRSSYLTKSRLSQIWNRNFTMRKFAFWNMLKNSNKADIYEKWITSTPIILPRKLQVKCIPDEPEQQRRLREKMSLDKFRMEIELLRLRAETNEQKYKSIDEQMQEEISKKAEGTLYDSTIKLWNEECQNEEMTSLQRWEKSDEWFSNYETEFKIEYNTENPFMKKEATKSYAQAVKQVPNRQRQNNSRNMNKSNYSGNFRQQNNFIRRNRSPSILRRNNIRNERNQFTHQNKKFNSGYENTRDPFRQDQFQSGSRNSYYRRQEENLINSNDYRSQNTRNQNLRDRFLEQVDRNQDTRWNKPNVRYRK